MLNPRRQFVGAFTCQTSREGIPERLRWQPFPAGDELLPFELFGTLKVWTDERPRQSTGLLNKSLHQSGILPSEHH
jgi:hypothetical protein